MTEKIDHAAALKLADKELRVIGNQERNSTILARAYIDLANTPIAEYHRNTVAMEADIVRLTERVALLDGLVGDTQDFLKHLIHGDYQYRFGDLVMANGMQHAKELNQHIKEALAALGGRDAK